MGQANKKIGLGSISLLLCIIGVLFAFSFGDRICYGDIVLKSIGLKSWSNGNSGLHYTVFYSLIFFIPAFILGYKFKNNLGATIGKVLYVIIITFIIITLILITISLFGAL